jgi:phospholipid/cholesterol/gamma-HCH transport system substrate-binding protein
MKRFSLEVIVGLFVIVGLLAVGYLSVKLGQVSIVGGNTYLLTALFPTISGLRRGAAVEIAGVSVGRVEQIKLEDYEALVTLRVSDEVKLQEDAIASIRTRGLIGDQYVRISPGGSDRLIPPGGRIRDVEPPLEVEDMIRRLVQGKI